jgi:hypothetical protein
MYIVLNLWHAPDVHDQLKEKCQSPRFSADIKFRFLFVPTSNVQFMFYQVPCNLPTTGSSTNRKASNFERDTVFGVLVVVFEFQESLVGVDQGECISPLAVLCYRVYLEIVIAV